ncbi:dnaJ homolog subfamily C member 10-like [Cardiocondyla obscurior]
MYKIIIILFVITFLTQAEDYYEILGISKTADQDEIRKAFKKLAIIYHPDKSNDPNAHVKFVQLTVAYETLKNSDLRKKYDLYGEDGFNDFNKGAYHSWSYHQQSLYDDNDHVINLDTNDYYESVINPDISWFVNFYSPMCSHCHDLAPAWKEVATLLRGIVKIAAVNCEFNRDLCYKVGIHSYPTLLYFQKNSHQTVYYNGKRTQEALMHFVFNKLNVYVPEINKSQWNLFLRGNNIDQRPMLIFTCGNEQNCFTLNERLIVAATFDTLIDVIMFTCKDDHCHDKMSHNTHAVYLPVYNASLWEPIFLDNLPDINTLTEKLSNQILSSIQELSDDDFERIRKTKSKAAWLVYFYTNDIETSKDLNLQHVNFQIKKLSIKDINLGKINCGRKGQLCSKWGVTDYPKWGMVKRSGAFELHHGRNIDTDIIKFMKLSVKAINVWALSAEEALSILQRNNGNEVWFLDWFTTWCPPCIKFLTELRWASLNFDASIVRFGTIDCTIHHTLCNQYNIQYYPTAMLINGSDTYHYMFSKTAANVIQFINEKRNPSVMKLTSKNLHRTLGKKKGEVIWIVYYFAPWCEPCQKLEPEWMAVTKSLSSLSFVNVATADCTTEESLCRSQKVHSYPSIRVYPLGSKDLNTFTLYNGQRSSLSILTWITTFFPKKVHDLDSFDYQKLLNSKNVWIVDFYLPQCYHCIKMKPEFAVASQLLEKVNFGRIDCSIYAHECAHIRLFPTLILYNSRHNIQHKITARTAEAIKDEILKIINSHTKHDEL